MPDWYPILHHSTSANYQFGDRELRAWQSMLRDAGSHNVTPWLQKESEVMYLLYKFYLKINIGKNNIY